MEFELPTIGERQSCGTLIGYLFFIREVIRKRKSIDFTPITDILTLYGCAFKNIDFEMQWLSELKHFRYYPIGEFETLCVKCIDFSNIIQHDIVFGESVVRGVPNMRCRCWRCK